MILRQISTCHNCHKSYRLIHYVATDEVKRKLLRLKNKCQRCGKLLETEWKEYEQSPLQVYRDTVMFLDTEFVGVRDGALNINLVNLMDAGYHGILTINDSKNVSKFQIDPVKRRVRRLSK